MKLRSSYALVIVTALLALMVIGCGSGGAVDDSASPGSGSVKITPAKTTILEAIAKGQILDGGMTPVRGVVAKSEDAGSLFYVAMEFSSAGADNAIGVWATSDLNGQTQIWAVDDVARNSTQWPRTEASSQRQYTMSSAGAQEAKDALK